LAILAEERARGPFPGLVHCFSGSMELAEKSVELGLMISLSGILTFKKAEAVRTAAASVPIDRLLVETDAPYLAPVPHRGKRNEPAFVKEVARQLGELRGISTEEIGDITSQNFYRFFSLPETLAP
jgi:TatD DNase family protein